MNTAELQKRYRARHRGGVILLRVPVVENKFAAALLAAERVKDDESRDRNRLAKEAGDVLAEWTDRWLEKFR